MQTTPKPMFFTTDRNGRRCAYRWSGQQLRAFRTNLAAAELDVATGQAIDIGGHPLKPVSA